MANPRLFKPAPAGPTIPPTDAVNEAGGRAYMRSNKLALAQYAATGCLNATFYASAEQQAERVRQLCESVEPEFVAKTAIYARTRGFMKDMPAFLTAYLSQQLAEIHPRAVAVQEKLKLATAKGDTKAIAAAKLERDAVLGERMNASHAFQAAFGQVIDNGKMLRNFVQMIRSGNFGRKSLAYSVSKMIEKWFQGHTPEQLFWQSTGANPSMREVIKLSRPKPESDEKRTMISYLLGCDVAKPGEPLIERREEKDASGKALVRTTSRYEFDKLPQVVKDWEAFKKNPVGAPPRVHWKFLESVKLTQEQWVEIAKRATWQEARMSLNKFARHGVFKDPTMSSALVKKLTDKAAIKKARVFPYQLLSAYLAASVDVPPPVKIAIQHAMDSSLENIPVVENGVWVFPDNSGSMDAAVTGNRDDEGTGAAAGARTRGHYHGATTSVSCRQAAALIAAAFLRRNPEAGVVPFDEQVHKVELNPLDSVMTNTEKLSNLARGGTNCRLPLAELNARKAKGDLVVYVSDYESWIDKDGRSAHGVSHATKLMKNGVGIDYVITGVMDEWAIYKKRNPRAKLVCIDLTPISTTQVVEREDILNVGGFSDDVFKLIAAFAKGGLTPEHWVGVIDTIKLDDSGPAEATPTSEAEDDEAAI